MTDRLSERTRFYLRHRRQIDEWANLEDEVSRAAHDFYAALAEPVERKLDGLPGSPLLYTHLGEGKEWPKIFLVHKSWHRKQGPPIVGIGLEWPRKPMFDNAYTGIWENRDGALESPAKDRHHRLIEAAQKWLPAGSGKGAHPPAYQAGTHWPYFRYERPKGEYWTGDEELDKFAEHLVSAITDLWAATWEVVHECIQSDPNSVTGEREPGQESA